MAASVDYFMTRSPNASTCSAGQINSPNRTLAENPSHITESPLPERVRSRIALALSCNENAKLVAILALELLVFDGKLHRESTSWTCPFRCHRGFPNAKDLMRHVPFCENFPCEQVYCNMCNSYNCFDSKEKPVSTSTPTSISTQNKALRKIKKLIALIPSSRSSPRQSPEPEQMPRMPSSQSSANMSISSSSSMSAARAMSVDFQSSEILSEICGNPIVELADSLFPHELGDSPVPQELAGTLIPQELTGSLIPQELTGSLIAQELAGSLIPQELTGSLIPQPLAHSLVPQELPDSLALPEPAHSTASHKLHMNIQPQGLPNTRLRLDLSGCHNSAPQRIPGFQPTTNDVAHYTPGADGPPENSEIDSKMNDGSFSLLSFDDGSYQDTFPPCNSAMGTEVQNYSPERNDQDLNLIYSNTMSPFHSEAGMQQFLHPISLDTVPLSRAHQGDTPQSSPTNNSSLSCLDSQSPVNSELVQRPNISIPVYQSSGDPWSLSLTSQSALLSPPTSASQSSSYSPSSHETHQYSPSLAISPSPITTSSQDGQILKCPYCNYVTKGSKTGSYRNYLKKHLDTHSDNRFLCPGCEKGFKRKDNMNVHRRSNCSGSLAATYDLPSSQVKKRLAPWLPKDDGAILNSVKAKRIKGIRKVSEDYQRRTSRRRSVRC